MNANYTERLLTLIAKLHLDTQYANDFIAACRHQNPGQIVRVIKAHSKRLSTHDLSNAQATLIYDKSLINYADEINQPQGETMDATPLLSTIFDRLRGYIKFVGDYKNENTAFGRRQVIHKAIREVFGEDVYNTITIAERKELCNLFDGEFNICSGTETKTRVKSDSSSTALELQETDIMTNAKPVEVRTFIFGQDATAVSDDTIFGQISNIEDKIANLNKIENKPAKLVAKIDGLKADIKALMDFVDAR